MTERERMTATGETERRCETCRHYLGGGQCALSMEMECADGDGKLMEVNYEITRAPTLTDGPRNPTEARVMKAFRAYLDKACKDQTIHDPTAWALQQTWRDFDGRKGRRA